MAVKSLMRAVDVVVTASLLKHIAYNIGHNYVLLAEVAHEDGAS